MTATRTPSAARPPRPGRRGGAGRVRRVLVGDERRIGIWMLPLFLVTALLAATLAGALAVLYYGQQVRDLRETTEAAQARLDEAAAEVEATAEEARAAIEEQVRQVRDSMAQGLPIGNPNDHGVYAVAADHPDGSVRVASAFAVFSDPKETFLLTSYRLVATNDGLFVDAAEVYLPSQTVRATVHSFDATIGLATLVLNGGPVPVLPWRPMEEPVTRGDRIYAAGIAGPDAPIVAEGRVSAVGFDAIVTTLPVNDFVDGGPLLDASGRVVAVTALGYEPFGPYDGGLTYAPPVRAVCRDLLRCTGADLGLGDPGGRQSLPDAAPGARSRPAPPAQDQPPDPTETSTETPTEDPTTDADAPDPATEQPPEG